MNKLELKGFTKEYQDLISEIFLRAGFAISNDADGDVVIETLNPDDDWILCGCKSYGLFE